jgi:putative membrane protein
MPTVYIKNFRTSLLVALVYGILKLLLTEILVLLSLPFIVLTLGLFYFIINAFLLWLTNKLIEGFEIRGCLSTIITSILISILDALLHWVIPGI